MWYGFGLILAFGLMLIGNKFLYQNAWFLYFIGVLMLILVLFFGVEVNNAKCWFKIPFIGSLQPSEFMKIFLIILFSKLTNEHNERYNNPSIFDEFKFLLKILILLLIPSLLTFIEPDTGAVIMYFVITITILFIGGIRKRWFIMTFSILIILGSIFLGIYFINNDLFIKIFGTSFFYRMDRIINWSDSTGLQLTNSLTAIGSAGALGHGINNTPIYFPELQTDFIFGVISSNIGFIGSILVMMLLIYFDISIIASTNTCNNNEDKYAIGGIIGVLIFQQIYNISMTVGLVPIMGITLPFLSYGGSSLLSYMLLLGIIFNVSNESLRFTN